MIIVEGCDGSGKTTLVNRLSDELSLRIGQRGIKDRDRLFEVTREDTYRALAHGVEGYHKPFLWDRLGPFSDPIYARVMGRNCAFKTEELRHCTEVFKALRAPIIICHVPLDVAKQNAFNEHQMTGVSENFDFIWEMYERLKDIITIDFNGIIYDYRVEGSYEKVRDHLRTYLTRRQAREWH